MARRRVMFTFPGNLIQEPIIYNLGIKYSIVTNVRQADVSEDEGWVMLELVGDEADIENGLKWVGEAGVRVDPVMGSALEG